MPTCAALEGLPARTGPILGTLPAVVEIVEGGLRYRIDVEHGQKTGFYLDQRDNRALRAPSRRGAARAERLLLYRRIHAGRTRRRREIGAVDRQLGGGARDGARQRRAQSGARRPARAAMARGRRVRASCATCAIAARSST